MTYPNNHGGFWTADDAAALVKAYFEGSSVENLMDTFGRSRNGIVSRLDKYGIDMNKQPKGNDMAVKELMEREELYDALVDFREGETLALKNKTDGDIKYVDTCNVFYAEGLVRLHPYTTFDRLQYVLDNFKLLEVSEEQDKYMVSVAGGRAPKKVHEGYESARHEAERLAKQNIGKPVTVLKLVDSIVAKQTIEIETCH